MEYKINCLNITDWETFHTVFQNALKFPDYYGRNMDAWIDCVDDLTDQRTLIHMTNSSSLKVKAPDILSAFFECAAYVNNRKIGRGEKAQLIVSIDD